MEAIVLTSEEEANILTLELSKTSTVMACRSYLDSLREAIVSEDENLLVFRASLVDGWETNHSHYPKVGEEIGFNYFATSDGVALLECCS